MINKVLLDVAMPGPLEGVARGFGWIIVFIILAFVIAIASIIIIRKGVKKIKAEEEKKTLEEMQATHDASKE